MKKLSLALLAAMITTFSGSMAQATVFNFDIIYWEGSDAPPATVAADEQAHFQIDDALANPTSTSARFYITGSFFGYAGDAVVDLYTARAYGGLETLPFPAGDPDYSARRELWGDSVFTGPTGAPVIHTGIYDMGDYGDRTGTYRVTVSEALAGGVPEPMSWALMIVGFSMAGAMYRRQRLNARTA